MKVIVSEGVPPRLQAEECWPATGHHWSNISYEHHVKANGRAWDRITPNGSTKNKPPQSPSPRRQAELERRSTLGYAVSNGVSDLFQTREAFEKIQETAEVLEELEWGELALSVSGLLDEVKGRRQQLVVQRVAKLHRIMPDENATMGVLLYKSYYDKLIAGLGGFFVQPPEDDDGLMQLGVTVIGCDGQVGQAPQDYEVSGLYLRGGRR